MICHSQHPLNLGRVIVIRGHQFQVTTKWPFFFKCKRWWQAASSTVFSPFLGEPSSAISAHPQLRDTSQRYILASKGVRVSSLIAGIPSKKPTVQDAEPGASTQGRSIPQLLHAGVVFGKCCCFDQSQGLNSWSVWYWGHVWNAHLSLGWWINDMGQNILDELVKQLSTRSFFCF